MNTYLLVYLIGFAVTLFMASATSPKDVDTDSWVLMGILIVFWFVTLPIFGVVMFGQSMGDKFGLRK